MIRAVLFDLDDTLFDHRYAARCSLRYFRDTHERLRAYTLEHLEQEDFRLLTEKHALVLAGTLDLTESRIQRIQLLFASCGEEISRDRARELASQRVEIYRNSRQAVPGAVALLHELKKTVRIGIVTNNFTEEQQGKLDACGLAPFADVLVTSENTGYVKPDPRIFQTALQRLECSPEEAVMVGDSWPVDIAGALHAGIRPVWFNRTGDSTQNVSGIAELNSFEPASEAAMKILHDCPRS